MINIVSLSRQKKCRIWLNELPDATYNSDNTIEKIINLDAAVNSETRSAAIELYIPVGPKQIYGLLGAVFQPRPGNDLVIQIKTGHLQTQRWGRSFGMEYDHAYQGLPAEYGDYALIGATAGITQSSLGSGYLLFDHAAHGIVSSSGNMFSILAELVVLLLSHPLNTSLETLTELVERRLAGRPADGSL